MLVLTRKHQEKIRIGENITITILKTKGKSVRVGIEAPAEVSVIRGELSFDGKGVDWDKSAATQPAHAAGVEFLGSLAERDRREPAWPAQANAKVASQRKFADAPGQVSLQRVPRAQVNRLLPDLLESGRGPLRAMLDERSVKS